MKNGYRWSDLHERSLGWALRARDRLLEDCRSIEDFQFEEEYSEDRETIVSVYGPPQVGKTTLILSLLGLGKNISIVSNIIRGGRKRGYTATSTATVYTRSSSDHFMLDYNGVCRIYEDDQNFAEGIDNVRRLIEDNPGTVDRLLIHIPVRYFEENGKSGNIKIVDLPGIGSDDEKEEEHVTRVVKKYFKCSKTIILVIDAKSLTSIGDISFTEHGVADWASQSRFKIVLTRSLSLADLRKLIEEHNGPELKDRICAYFKGELKRSLEDRMQDELEVYPLEVGDSLNNFLNEYPQYADSITAMQGILIDELIRSITRELTSEGKILEIKSVIKGINSRIKLEGLKRDKQIQQVHKAQDKANLKLEMVKALFEMYETAHSSNDKIVQKIDEQGIGLIKPQGGDADASDASQSESLGEQYDYMIESVMEDIREMGLDVKSKDAVASLKNKLHDSLYAYTKELCDFLSDDIVPKKTFVEANKDKMRKYYRYKMNADSVFQEIRGNFNGFNHFTEKLTRKRWLLHDSLQKDYIGVCNSLVKEFRQGLDVVVTNRIMCINDYLKTLIWEEQEVLENYLKCQGQFRIKFEKALEQLKARESEIEEKYDFIIKALQADEERVRKFYIYLENEFINEYNNCMEYIEYGTREEKMMYLLYGKLITNKYREYEGI